MKYLLMSNYFAATYDCNTYGSGAYNSSEACNAALSSTGTDVAIGIGVGLILIAVAVIMFLKNRKKK